MKGKIKTNSYQFISTLEKSDNKLWGCHLPVPEDVAAKLINEDSKRVVCTLNGKETYQCAILYYKKGKPVISVNKKIRDTLKLAFGMDVNVSLKKDTSEYGLPLPEELVEVFRQDKEGKKVFHSLTLGKQRTLLYIVGQAKDPEKRVFRSLVIVQHLKENKGKIEYKQLSAMLRTPFR